VAPSTTETSHLYGRWLLRWGILALVAMPLIAYIASYYLLSRRGVAEAAAQGMPGFYYVSLDRYYHSPTGREVHHRLLLLYAPLNWIDTTLFGGLPAARGGVEKLTVYYRGFLGEHRGVVGVTGHWSTGLQRLCSSGLASVSCCQN